MDFIKGFTFGWLSGKGELSAPEARESLRLMKERTNSEYVIFALAALQDTAHTTVIDFEGSHMPADQELVDMIAYAREMGLKVILKPTVNVKDGTWRAHINFFDIDVPCEPKWSEWFGSYKKYQLHYAKIAQDTACEMFIAGCEMVQTERRETEWRKLIADVKEVYKGPVTYNTDKYQEGNVNWWDAVDVISSSGYYPIDDWDRQLDRIEAIIAPYNKPFFFAEAGCPSRTGSAQVPNDWNLEGDVNLAEQEQYYKVMFEETKKRRWVKGFGLWDWSAKLYSAGAASSDDGYGVYEKPAEKVIHEFYSSL